MLQGVLLVQVTGTTHNVVGLVNHTSTSTRFCCSQVPTPSTASLLVINTKNPQQIEVMEFELIVAVFGDGDYKWTVWTGLYGDAIASYKHVTYSDAGRPTSISLIRSSHHVVICTWSC